MRVFKTVKDFVKIKGKCCLTIGNFDGVHRGHQKILSAAKEVAANKNLSLAVVTFEPHPAAVLHPDQTPERLTNLLLKSELLAKYGADYVCLLKADKELLNLAANDFIKNVIVSNFKPKVFVEGENFRFGANRTGNIDTLIMLGEENGFDVEVIEQAEVKLSIGSSVKISSTLIRNLLIEGKVADASIALGRTYKFIGQVVRGKGEGKMLGTPTANLGKISQLVPQEGVYAAVAATGEDVARVCKSNAQIPAAVSIGTTPTFGNANPLLVEAHLLDENVGNLYGKWMAIDFVEKIRDQQKFANEKELADAIAEDCNKTRHILAHPKI